MVGLSNLLVRRLRPVAALMAACGALLAGCGGPPAAGDVNVLLLTVDTVRADHLSSYGYARETTPSIDRLAAEGVLFSNVYAQRSGTWPSLTSILTSRHPRSHGVRANGEQLDPAVQTIAELLAARGYTTAAFLCNMINAPNRGFAEKQGFKTGDRDAAALRAVLPWLESNRDRSFFLWVHLMGPHDPYTPGRGFSRKFDTGYRGPLDGKRLTLDAIYQGRLRLSRRALAHIISRYDAKLAEVDSRVGAILDQLDRLDLADRTLVVFGSDHGEELYDHNFYFLHSASIYASALHVPLIVRLPGVLPAGARVDAVSENLDIAPTIFELLEVPTPAEFEGASLLGRIRGEKGEDAPGRAISELGSGVYSLRTGRWHYIYNPKGYRGQNGWFPVEREELYDVVSDPLEKRDLAAERRDVAHELWSDLDTWIGEGPDEYRPQALSPEVRDELRALGYIQ